MNLSQLVLYNFRSYEERRFDFSPEITVLSGSNGVGKTNVLEAVYVLLRGKSFRDSDEHLRKYDTVWWRVTGHLGDHEREVRFAPEQSVYKQLIVDGVNRGRFSYKQQLPVVLFEPDDLLLIHGSPGMRRAYLDNLLISTLPSYRTNLSRYERALLQRNNLLKRNSSSEFLKDAVFVWDIALSEHGAKITEARLQLVDQLNEKLSQHYSNLSGGKDELRIEYTPTHRDSHALVRELSKNLEKDALRGFTSTGPHRDDISFVLNGKDARTSASRGEIRTIVLALKYAELNLLKGLSDNNPLLLLDDVFSELDQDRQTALLAQTADVQKIITTTHAPRRKGVQTIAL